MEVVGGGGRRRRARRSNASSSGVEVEVLEAPLACVKVVEVEVKDRCSCVALVAVWVMWPSLNVQARAMRRARVRSEHAQARKLPYR